MASPSGNSSTTVVEDENRDQANPDTEEDVSEQAEDVIRSVMSQRLHMALRNEEEDVTVATPSLAEFTVPLDPFSSSTNIGRHLAQIGHQFDSQYNAQFTQMINILNITPATANEAFTVVAQRLFAEGINWGRIAVLLMFGYRIAIDVARNATHFMKNIIQTLVKFIISEKIAKWIADQGGWISALSYETEQPSWQAMTLVCGLAAVSVIAAVYLSRK